MRDPDHTKITGVDCAFTDLKLVLKPALTK
jgi:hypothetical protein